MNKSELTSRVYNLLYKNGVSKKISIPKQTFHISDNTGSYKDFTVKSIDKAVNYNCNDIEAIIEAAILVVEEALKNGEEVSLHSFGKLFLHHRAARKTKLVGTEEWVDVEARYVPKFVPGKNLKMAAKVYELSLEDKFKQEDGE